MTICHLIHNVKILLICFQIQHLKGLKKEELEELPFVTELLGETNVEVTFPFCTNIILNHDEICLIDFFQALTPMEVPQNREGPVQEANGKPPSHLHNIVYSLILVVNNRQMCK